MPLITHAGDERRCMASASTWATRCACGDRSTPGYGWWWRIVLRWATGTSTTCARRKLGNFELFAQLMDDARYRTNLFGDISAMTQNNRMSVVATLLERRDWHERLLNGSDYPLPGVVPLIP